MGFCWGVEILLEYCVPIKLHEKVSFWYMLKRLAKYEPGYAKRAHDATTDEPLAKVLLKRTSQSIIVLIDSPEYCRDEAEKTVENPTTLEKRFHYNPDIGWGEEREYLVELERPELLAEAFELAASKILGEDHGFTLKLFRGGCDGEVEEPGKERALFVTYKPLHQSSGGSLEVGHNRDVNVPWGVNFMTASAAPDGVAQKMEQLVKAFGLEAEGDPGWRLITQADGG